MENDQGKGGITGAQIAFAVGLGILGLSAIRWILSHPEQARKIDMGILLGTQKASLAISDALRAIANRFRFVADKAGTQYNNIRG